MRNADAAVGLAVRLLPFNSVEAGGSCGELMCVAYGRTLEPHSEDWTLRTGLNAHCKG